MQERSNTHPLQTCSQEEPASSSLNHASLSPSKAASRTIQHRSCEESTLGLSSAAIQLLLLVIILYSAHLQYPHFHPGFLVACGTAFVLLLVRKSWAATRQTANRAPTTTQHPAQQQMRQHTIQPRTPNLTGVWIKDKAASDSMEPTLHLMKVNRLIRSAVGLVKGTQLNQSDNSFEITVLSGILWFKIREEYPLTGEVRRFKRRDLRKGLHRGTAEKLPDGAVCITLEWDEPLGGVGTDIFYVPAPNLLYVDSTILMHGQTIKYRTVYHKQQ